MFGTERPYVSVRHKIHCAKKALHIEPLVSLISFKATTIQKSAMTLLQFLNGQKCKSSEVIY